MLNRTVDGVLFDWHERGRIFPDSDCDMQLLADEIERLRAIEDQMPTTADEVPVVPGSVVWFPYNDFTFGEGPHKCIVKPFQDWEDDDGDLLVWCEMESEDWVSKSLDDCYSTREAAEAARAIE